MSFNVDGFNERTNYIHNSNDMNKLKKNGPSNVDNSFAKMRVDERKNLVETVNTDITYQKEEVKGDKDKFILRNNNMRNANVKPSDNNQISNALNRNLFRK